MTAIFAADGLFDPSAAIPSIPPGPARAYMEYTVGMLRSGMASQCRSCLCKSNESETGKSTARTYRCHTHPTASRVGQRPFTLATEASAVACGRSVPWIPPICLTYLQMYFQSSTLWSLDAVTVKSQCLSRCYNSL